MHGLIRRRIALTVSLLGAGLALGAASSLLDAAESTRESGIRTYRTRNAQGEEILHITNLDDLGNRIGGELPPAAPPDPAAARCEREHYGDDEPADAAPVIVNVYPPAGPEGRYDDCVASDPRYCTGMYAGDYTSSGYYSGQYPGIYPGYYPSAGYGRHDGHRRHAKPSEGLFGRPRAINTRPYSRGTASQRNRAYFGRRH